jgi:hypothetical protein
MKKILRKGFQTSALAAMMVVFMGLLVAGFASAAEAEVDLSVTIGVPEHVAPGAQFTVNLAYSNLGETASPEDTFVMVKLPDGIQYVASIDQAGQPLEPEVVGSNQLTWQVGSLAAGSCCKHIWITLAVASDLPEGQELEVQAEVGSSAAETLTDNNIASDIGTVCDMAGSTKQVQAGQVQPGDVLTYTIQLRLAQRSGPAAIQQRTVTLEDTLPLQSQLRFLGWVGPITGDWDGHTLRWQGQVRAGEPLTLQFRAGVEGDVPTGTVITNTARLSWAGMQMRLGPAETTVTVSPEAKMIGPTGYHWQHANGVSISVPPGAVAETTRFEYHPLFTEAAPPEVPYAYLFAHRAFELNAFHFGELNQFEQPITLTLRLQAQELAGFKANTLRLWYRNGPGEPWVMLGEPVWLSDDTLSFTSSHFTQFALFGLGQHQVYLPSIVH